MADDQDIATNLISGKLKNVKAAIKECTAAYREEKFCEISEEILEKYHEGIIIWGGDFNSNFIGKQGMEADTGYWTLLKDFIERCEIRRDFIDRFNGLIDAPDKERKIQSILNEIHYSRFAPYLEKARQNLDSSINHPDWFKDFLQQLKCEIYSEFAETLKKDFLKQKLQIANEDDKKMFLRIISYTVWNLQAHKPSDHDVPLFSYGQEKHIDQFAQTYVKQFYEEGPLKFPPTYKFETNYPKTYSAKRIPTHVDRIVWKAIKGVSVTCEDYDIIHGESFNTSDHRPVWAYYRVKTMKC